jgi:uncharacterized protein YacL
MLLTAVRLLYAFVCAGAFATYVNTVESSETGNHLSFVATHPFLAFILLLLISQSITVIDICIRRKRIEVISAIYFGLLIGIVLSYLLNQALLPLVGGSELRSITFMCTTLVLPYVCISLLLQTKDDFRFVIPYVEFAKEVKGGRPFLLDTSSIIDGRIADVIDTKIVDSELIVPNFILQELQDIADSNDRLRRNRGRRGLDVLSKLRSNPHVEIKLYEANMKDLKGMNVDQQLVHVAKLLGGRILTNDFNLNKVASVQGVDVINLNDVANSLKPRYLPGEQLQIKIIKPGEAPGQGVGYLDDGTMVVCELASSIIGKDANVVVTSVLQNSAGRMIFGKLSNATDRN